MIDTYTVTVKVENGTAKDVATELAASGELTVDKGADKTLTFAPKLGYALDTVTVDDEPAILDENGSYTFEDITSDHTIEVVYAEDKIGGTGPEKPGDGIPDKYQATVTYEVEDGTWADGAADPVKQVVTFKDAEGNYVEPGTVGATHTALAVPQATSGAGYGGGSWNVASGSGALHSETGAPYAVTGDATFTRSFERIPTPPSPAETTYTVRHWYQDVYGDGYTLDAAQTETLPGTAGDTTAAVAKQNLAGFHAIAFDQQVIAPDGSTEVDVYYDRNVHAVSYSYAGDVPAGAPAAPASATYRYGQAVAVAAAPALAGWTFSGWTRGGALATGFEMPDSDVELVGTWTEATAVVPGQPVDPVVPVTPPTVPTVPTAPATATPAAPAAPAAAAPAAPAAAAPAAEPIADDATPQAAAPAEGTPLAETEQIEDEATPMGAFDEPHCWVHWVMLIGIILTAVYGIVVVRRRLGMADDVDDYEKQVLGIQEDETVSASVAGHQAL